MLLRMTQWGRLRANTSNFEKTEDFTSLPTPYCVEFKIAAFASATTSSDLPAFSPSMYS